MRSLRMGYADPDRLTIGGYSYGGYMTNWADYADYTVQGGRAGRARWSMRLTGATTMRHGRCVVFGWQPWRMRTSIRARRAVPV